MDHYRAYELHFRFSREVDELEKELETEKQNALQELQKAKNEIENIRAFNKQGPTKETHTGASEHVPSIKFYQ